jgi:hypothetical protein
VAVHDLREAGGQDHDVRRLDVTVDDPMRVGVIERLGDPCDDAQRLPPVGTAFFRDLGERAAVEVLESDEEDALLLVASDVVHHHDAWMGQPGGDAGLGQEATLVFFAFPHGSGGQVDGLEGDGPAEGGVVDLVDDTHHAAAKLLADLVAADLGRQGRIMFARKP